MNGTTLAAVRARSTMSSVDSSRHEANVTTNEEVVKQLLGTTQTTLQLQMVTMRSPTFNKAYNFYKILAKRYGTWPYEKTAYTASRRCTRFSTKALTSASTATFVVCERTTVRQPETSWPVELNLYSIYKAVNRTSREKRTINGPRLFEEPARRRRAKVSHAILLQLKTTVLSPH